MKALHIGITTAVVLALAGCSTDEFSDKRIDYRAAAVQVPSLEVPPDLTAPGADDRYKVPQGDGSTVATYSDYSGATQGHAVSTAVLPEVKDVHLERNGVQRWLVVKEKPENVWNVVKAFIQENGLTIKTEDQAAGLIETEWSENRAKIPLDGVRKWLGKVIDSVYSSGERDKYSVRLERAKDGENTEVYITHHGMEEVKDGESFKWQPRPEDPEMEAVMLQRLMVRLGANESQAAKAVSGGEGGAAATTGASTAMGTAVMQQASSGGRIIVINDTFDRAWRRVGLALEQADFGIEDKDRAKGIYFLSQIKAEKGWMDKLKFWSGDEESNKRYRVNVKDGGAACEVSVVDQNGAGGEHAGQILEAIYKNINE